MKQENTKVIKSPITISKISLTWKSENDYDLCAFYSCLDGKIGSVIPEEFIGHPSNSKYMQVNYEYGGELNDTNSSSIIVNSLQSVKSLYIIVLDYSATIEDGLGFEEENLKIKITLSDSTTFLMKKEEHGPKGPVWFATKISFGTEGLMITEVNEFLHLEQAIQSIPGFYKICGGGTDEDTIQPITSEKTYYFNGSSLTVAVDDILNSNSDVIVSSDNHKLLMLGGISGAIKARGGMGILEDAKKHNIALLGDVIVTSAGKLPQKYIFHCVTVNRLQNNINHADDVDLATYTIQHSIDRCFFLLNALEMNSIAFPTIGAGHARIPLDTVLNIMAERIVINLKKTNRIINVRLCLYDQFGQIDLMKYIPLFSKLAVLSNEPQNTMRLEKKGMRPPQKSHSSCLDIDVFISYSRVDTHNAEKIVQILTDNNIKCWIDKDGIYSGDNFKENIVDAIDSSKVVIFLSSKSSNESRFCIREVEYAIRENKVLLPVCIDFTPFAKSIRMDMVNLDYIDFDTIDVQQNRLLTSIKYAIEKNR